MALHHANPSEIVDLSPLGKELENTKSVALIKTDQFEAIRLVVQKGLKFRHMMFPVASHCIALRDNWNLSWPNLLSSLRRANGSFSKVVSHIRSEAS